MNFKKEFNLLNKITFLDSAAGTLKPKSVINAISNFYNNISMNSHSSDTPLGIEASKVIEDTRNKVAKLTKSKKEEVILTSGTTDSLNRISRMLDGLVKKSDNIVISKYVHNANFANMSELSKRTGAKLKAVEDVVKNINTKTKIVAVSQINNAFGNDVDLNKVYKKAKSVGAIVINDAAQAITYASVSLKNSDVIAFSSNKLYGPTGSGALIIKKDLLKKLKPATYGGGAIADVKKDLTYVLKSNIKSFEPGTPDAAGLAGFGAGIDFYNKTKEFIPNIKRVSLYAHKKMQAVKDITIHTKPGKGILLFNIKGVPSQGLVSMLSRKGIYLRAGAFCNHMGLVEPNGSVRMSFGIYTTKKDIDKAIKEIKKGDVFDFL